MLTYSEMVAVVDRHTSYSPQGKALIDIPAIRKELVWEWAFTELQVKRIILDMRDRGLV